MKSPKAPDVQPAPKQDPLPSPTPVESTEPEKTAEQRRKRLQDLRYGFMSTVKSGNTGANNTDATVLKPGLKAKLGQ